MKNDGANLYTGVIASIDQGVGACTNKTIDLTPYTKLCVDCNIIQRGKESADFGYINAYSVKPSSWGNTNKNIIAGKSIGKLLNGSDTKQTLTVDISSINTSGYIMISSNTWDGSNPLEMSFNKVWLEG